MGEKDKGKYRVEPKKRVPFRVSCNNCEHSTYLNGVVTSDMVRPRSPVCRVKMVLSGLFCSYGCEMTDEKIEEAKSLYFRQAIEYYYGRGQRRVRHNLPEAVPLQPVHKKDYCPQFLLRHDYRRRRFKTPWSRYLDPDEV